MDSPSQWEWPWKLLALIVPFGLSACGDDVDGILSQCRADAMKINRATDIDELKYTWLCMRAAGYYVTISPIGCSDVNTAIISSTCYKPATRGAQFDKWVGDMLTMDR